VVSVSPPIEEVDDLQNCFRFCHIIICLGKAAGRQYSNSNKRLLKF
jgi:hypothetical protein